MNKGNSYDWAPAGMGFPTVERSLARAVSTACTLPSILAVVIADGCDRSRLLQGLAEQHAGVFATCERTRGYKRFMESIANAVGGIDGRGRQHDRIVERLRGSGKPLFLDRADNLSTRQLGVLRGFHDLAGVAIVLGSPTRTLTDALNDTDRGGQLFSRSMFFVHEPPPPPPPGEAGGTAGRIGPAAADEPAGGDDDA